MTDLHAAELAYARFNALRTANAPTEVLLGEHADFLTIREPSRPDRAYTNRAIWPHHRAPGAQALAKLPPGIRAVELPAQALVPDVADRLAAAGFAHGWDLTYLQATPRPAPQPAGVSRWAEPQAEQFLDLLVLEGVHMPPELRERVRHHYCTAEFPAFVAHDAAGRPWAWATMFITQDVAFLGNAYTLPDARRAGKHAALLAARLAWASTCGLRVAYTDVETGSASQAHCERAGFAVHSHSAVWTRGA